MKKFLLTAILSLSFLSSTLFAIRSATTPTPIPCVELDSNQECEEHACEELRRTLRDKCGDKEYIEASHDSWIELILVRQYEDGRFGVCTIKYTCYDPQTRPPLLKSYNSYLPEFGLDQLTA